MPRSETGPTVSAPFISVIVPTYQSASFIGDMLESLRGQSFRDFEVVISDGASKDDTIEIARRSGLPNLVIDCRPDEGVPDALNRGFALAKGRVLCWLNSDDFYVSNKTLGAVAQAFQSGSASFAYGHSLVADSNGLIQRELYAHIPRQGFQHHGTNLMTGSLFFTRNAWRSFGGFSGCYRFAFEYELVKYLFRSCGRPSLIDSFLCAFRVHPQGLSSIQKGTMAFERDEILADVQKKSRWLGILERKTSQTLQNTLLPSIRARYGSRRVNRHWREIYSEESI
jgi:glycosyltransferase involved in cell wall biosynthesis